MKTIEKKQAEPIGKCFCGCQGKPKSKGAFFLPGHDQRALNNAMAKITDCPPIEEFKGIYPKNDMRVNWLLSLGFIDENANLLS